MFRLLFSFTWCIFTNAYNFLWNLVCVSNGVGCEYLAVIVDDNNSSVWRGVKFTNLGSLLWIVVAFCCYSVAKRGYQTNGVITNTIVGDRNYGTRNTENEGGARCKEREEVRVGSPVMWKPVWRNSDTQVIVICQRQHRRMYWHERITICSIICTCRTELRYNIFVCLLTGGLEEIFRTTKSKCTYKVSVRSGYFCTHRATKLAFTALCTKGSDLPSSSVSIHPTVKRMGSQGERCEERYCQMCFSSVAQVINRGLVRLTHLVCKWNLGLYHGHLNVHCRTVYFICEVCSANRVCVATMLSG